MTEQYLNSISFVFACLSLFSIAWYTRAAKRAMAAEEYWEAQAQGADAARKAYERTRLHMLHREVGGVIVGLDGEQCSVIMATDNGHLMARRHSDGKHVYIHPPVDGGADNFIVVEGEETE